jgi:ABC-type nitrate/sulfonate/bicarbonate transport system permease component
MWTPFVATGLRMLCGWALASLAGIAIGAAIGSSRLAHLCVEHMQYSKSDYLNRIGADK